MRTLFLFLLFGFMVIANNITAQTTASQQLQTIISTYEEASAKKPEAALWPMHVTEELAQRDQQLAQTREQLAALNTTELSETELINQEMLALIVQDELFRLRFQDYSFPLNAEGGFLANLVYDIRGTQLNTQDDLKRYLERLAALPLYFERQTELMKQGQAVGKSSPKLVVQNCIQLIDYFLATEPEESFYYLIANTDAQRAVIRSTLSKEVYPAYLQLRNFLASDYLLHAPSKVGISAITDGKAYYEQRVRFFTTFDISPQEVFDTGMAEVARIRTEMEAIITSLSFEGSFADFFDFLRKDPQFYCNSPQALLDRAAWITTKTQGQLPKYFGRLPRMPLDVVPVPDALAPSYTTGRYSPGNDEQQKSGQYWVNTYQLESRPLYVLPSLSLHEGVPGHHLQLMLAQELEGLPKFRNNYLSAFGEGWGLYAEHLGQEMGIYTTAYEQFGRLTYEMWRACRLVVDPGMHYFGWTRQRAFDFMAENTALSLHEVGTEIDRYIGWPGQAVSYKMGELKIKELRERAEVELGDLFNIRDFHDVILRNGSVPLAALERVIDNWLKTKLDE